MRGIFKGILSSAHGIFGFCLKLLGLLIALIPVVYIAVILIGIVLAFSPMLVYSTAGLLVALFLFFKLRRLFKRRKFLRALRAFCKERGGEVRFFGHPMGNALFRVRAGAEMQVGGKRITLYFLACLKRGTRVCFLPDGCAVFYERIRFRRITLFSWQHYYQFADEPEEGSYLLLMPAPSRSYVQRIHDSCEVDNGTACGRYSIFTGGAFLRHIERVL